MLFLTRQIYAWLAENVMTQFCAAVARAVSLRHEMRSGVAADRNVPYHLRLLILV